jgi:hypothetical protein
MKFTISRRLSAMLFAALLSMQSVACVKDSDSKPSGNTDTTGDAPEMNPGLKQALDLT